MFIEWEIILACNYKCKYCGLLDSKIKPIIDEKILYNFIKELNIKYKNIEIFIFGGEPFLHPKIEFIIETLQEFNQPYVIQTNLSKHSSKKIIEINKNININISIHPDHWDNNLSDIVKINKYANIKNIDIMFSSEKAFDIYDKIIIFYKNSVLCPVTNIGCEGYENILKMYNECRNNIKYKKYNFEQTKKIYNDEEMFRSDIWEKQNNNEIITFNKPCMYKDQFILFDPQLNNYNCCYRKNNNGICKQNACFFM